MTDLPLATNDLDPGTDDELVFEEVAPAPRKSRRAPAKARDAAAGADAPAAELPPSAAPDEAAADEPADPPVPDPRPGDASAGSEIPMSAAPRDRRQLLLVATVCLALFTSLMSLGGLIAVSRTLAAAQAQRAEAQDERDALLKLPATIAALDRATARLDAAAGHTVPAVTAAAAVPAPPGGALTSEDFHHGLDSLRLALDNRQPTSVNAVGDTLHAGFAEVGARLDRIDAQLSRPARPATAH